MKDLYIEGSRVKPDLHFSVSTGVFNISGQSLPENAMEVFGPVLDWMDEYSKSPCPKTLLTFKMKYYNTASSKYFFTLIKKLNSIFKNGADVEVEWYYQNDDEDMLDAGEYFQGLVDIPFNFISY